MCFGPHASSDRSSLPGCPGPLKPGRYATRPAAHVAPASAAWHPAREPPAQLLSSRVALAAGSAPGKNAEKAENRVPRDV